MCSIFRSNNADFVGVSIIVNGYKRSGKMEVTTLWVGKYPLPGFDVRRPVHGVRFCRTGSIPQVNASGQRFFSGQCSGHRFNSS